jgi:hypothetical protein
MNTTVMERPPLVSIVGTVLNITPALAANRSGKIKLDDGKILSAFPDKLQIIEVGRSYDFGCVVTQKAGVNYHDVKAIRAAPQPQAFRAPPSHAPAVRATDNYPSHQAARRDAAAQPQRTAPVQHEAPQHTANDYNRQTHPADARRMFVCAQISALIKSHQLQVVPLNPVAITETIDLLAKAYDQSCLGGD